jgi:putative ABC transport system permease protein
MLATLRYSTRILLTKPGFSLVVIATLGLAIGAASTVFSLFDAVLLRPFPFRDPDRLVRIRMEQPDLKGSEVDASLFDFWDWRRDARSFENMAAYVTFPSTLTTDGPAQSVRLSFATPELFDVLGVKPALGQTYSRKDDQLGGNVRQALLSHALWQQLFHGRRDVAGQTLRLRGESYTVAGVMPPGFDFPDRTGVWVPLMARYGGYTREWWKRRDMRPHVVLGRLKPDVSLDQAKSEMQALTRAQGIQFPDTNRRFTSRLLTLRDSETGNMRPYILMVGTAVLLLLGVGMVNVANLFVARAASREREFAIRTALGAGRWQMTRQLLSESFLYAFLGCGLGIVLAKLGVLAIGGVIPVDLPQWMTFRLDWRVISFATIASAVTALFFGLSPLLQTFRIDPNDSLKQGTKGSSGGGLAGSLRSGLVIVEVALSVVLLIGAGLLLRSFSNLMAVDTGIQTQKLVVATISRFLAKATPEESYQGYALEVERMRTRIAGIPGVSSVAAGNDVPYLNRPEQRRTVEIYTRRRPTKDDAYRGPAAGADVTPGYFATLGIPILEGRDFNDRDNLTAPKAIIISQRSAEILFGRRTAVGEQIRWGNDQDYDPWTTVVGVVGNTRWHPAENESGVEVYWSYGQYPSPNTNLIVRTDADSTALLESLRRAVHDVNPDFAIEQVKTMDTVVAESVWQRRLWSFVLATFAALALALASVGLYGVMSFIVTQRTKELGIRLAIGARSGNVLHLILSQGTRLVIFGATAGLILSFAAGRYMESILFGVAPFDLLTYLAVPLVLFVVSLAACAAPAWRASRIDPLHALRQE